MNKYILKIIFCFLVWNQGVYSQQITIVKTIKHSVCQKSTFTIILQNNTNTDFASSQLSLTLPCGFAYVKGSITLGTDLNISNLQLPIFMLPSIKAGNTVNVNFTSDISCDILPCIEAREIFNIKAQWKVNSIQKDYISDPFNVYSPNLVITNIVNPYKEASYLSNTSRTIKITNSLLGKLDHFFLKHTFDPYIISSLKEGKTIQNTVGQTTILLDSTYFKSIGNHDRYFDQNEVAEINENVFIQSCPTEKQVVLSNFDAWWECDNLSCQTSNAKATIKILPTDNKGAKLLFKGVGDEPECYKPGKSQPYIQMTELSHATALIETEIIVHFPYYQRGVIVGSVDASFANKIEYLDIFTNPCGEKVAQKIILKIDRLEPTSFSNYYTIGWETGFCEDADCRTKKNYWVYGYTYKKECAAFDDYLFSDTLAVQDTIIPVFYNYPGYSVDEIIQSNPVINPDEIGTFFFDMSNSKFKDTAGVLNIRVVVPKALEILPSDYNLAGKLPQSVTITPEGDNNILVLTYQLPLPAVFVSLKVLTKLNCDLWPVEPCHEETYSSCPCYSTSKKAAIVNFSANIDFLDGCSVEQRPNTCSDYKLNFRCRETSICYVDTLAGYWDFVPELIRTTWGQMDINNDNIPDQNTPLDTSKLSKYEILPGDSFQIMLKGPIIVDLPDSSFSKLYLNMGGDMRFSSNPTNFKFMNQFLFGEKAAIKTSLTRLEIFLKGTGKHYIINDVREEYQVDTSITYNLSPSNLHQLNPDFPETYRYQEGDSLAFLIKRYLDFEEYKKHQADLKYDQFFKYRILYHTYLGNKTPKDSRIPPSKCDCKYGGLFIAGFNLQAFPSGTILVNGPNCPSDEQSRRVLLLKMGHTNLFFNEFRSIFSIPKVRFSKPTNFDIVGLDVTFLRTKNTFFPRLSGDFVYFDLDENIFTNDKYQKEITNNDFVFDLKFKPNKCIDKSDAQPIDLTVFFHSNETGKLFFPDSINGRNYIAYLVPKMYLDLKQKEITAYSNKVEIAFDIKKDSVVKLPIQNVFVKIHTPGGKFINQRLFDTTNQKTYYGDHDVYYLGSVDVLEQLNLSFLAQSQSCGTEMVIFEYGFDCEPFTNPAKKPCFYRKDTVYIAFPSSVIELKPAENAQIFELCEETEQKITVFNGGLGSAYEMNVKYKLPEGMAFVSGSAFIKFPTSSTNSFPISDPQTIDNQLYEWDLSSFWEDLHENGLSGIAFSPNNSFDIEFKTTTNCDFVSGTFITYFCDGLQNCGSPTNKVTKVSETFDVKDVEVDYVVDLKAKLIFAPSCTDNTGMLDIAFKNPSTGTAILQVDIPNSWRGDLTSINTNLPNPIPMVSNGKWTWSITGSMDSVRISFPILFAGTERCFSEILTVLVTEPVNAFCQKTSESCSINVVTGTKIIDISVDQPKYIITNTSAKVLGDITRFDITIQNISPSYHPSLIANIYWDVNHDGLITSMDSLLALMPIQGFDQNNRIISSYVDKLGLSHDKLCEILVVLDGAENCLCEDILVPFAKNIEVNQTPIVTCSEIENEIGVNTDPNAVYQWNNESYLSCSQCSKAVLIAKNLTANDLNFQKILLETKASGCMISNIYDITVRPAPSLLSGNLDICQGDTLIAIATQAESYLWQGPSIITNGQQILVANPQNTTDYTVKIKDQYGCEGQAFFHVNVHALPSAIVTSDSSQCFGKGAKLNIKTDPNNIFRWAKGGERLSSLNVLDPLVVVQEDFTFVLEIQNQFCSNKIEIPIHFYEGFTVQGIKDTIKVCQGEQINVKLPTGFSYEITPAQYVKCQNPTCDEISCFLQGESQLFHVIATNSALCSSETDFLLVAAKDTIKKYQDFSICKGDSILIGQNYISQEGYYCDTIKPAGTSCFTIQCGLLKINNTYLNSQNVVLCPGETVDFFGQTIDNEGKYCKSLQTYLGCDSTTCWNVKYEDQPVWTIAEVVEMKEGDSIQVNLPPGYDYQWTPVDGLSCSDCSNPIIYAINNITYTIEIIDSLGCNWTRNIKIVVTENCIGSVKEIPNAFTPNNDGINDFYTLGDIKLCGPMKITVFNRWGNIVYEQENWDNHWDGFSKNGGELPQATYFVVIDFISEGESRKGMIDLRKK